MGEQSVNLVLFKPFNKEASEQQINLDGYGSKALLLKLDSKTAELAYIVLLAALRLEGGTPFSPVKPAKLLGAKREESSGTIRVNILTSGKTNDDIQTPYANT